MPSNRPNRQRSLIGVIAAMAVVNLVYGVPAEISEYLIRCWPWCSTSRA